MPFVLPPAARPGQSAAEIDTPSLVLDLDVLEANLDRMQAAASAAGVHLRPHAKAHKCPDIALAQIARGAVGVCCQKVSEAVPFVAAGVTDIHISNEVAGPAKAAMLAQLARSARLSVCVDDATQVAALAAACAEADSRLDVFEILGLDSDGDAAIDALPPHDGGRVLVVGSEGSGLRRLVRERCHRIVSIRQTGAVESLNASVAAAIAIYELTRAPRIG